MIQTLRKRLILAGLLLLACISHTQAQTSKEALSLHHILPTSLTLNTEQIALTGTYNPTIPTPKAILGFELGEQYCDWSDVVRYLEALDAASERIRMVELGRSYEHRPFLQLLITSPENHARLEQIKAEHHKLLDPQQSAALDLKAMPLMVDIACSMHGDEPSGVHAAMAMAYFLAASEEQPVTELLDKTILSLVPGANPDGIHRFAVWVNSSVGARPTLDAASFEYNQPWPSCRLNHYWADTNRDLLMCQHPEGRIAVSRYLEWMPTLVLDLHEKRGANGAFYHSPGHPKRLHPYVTAENQALTGEIGAYVTEALKPLGAKPYSGCEFDDLYLGKGAAYGDVQGSVCLLFEQPKLHNHAYRYEDRILNFPQSIRNQLEASLGALSAGYDLREKLLHYQREWYRKAAIAAQQSSVKGYLFHAHGDRARAYRLLENLAAHQIEVYHLAKDITVGEQHFAAEDSFLIPLESQRFFHKTKGVWERLTPEQYEDTFFYDISAWSFPLAYQVAHAEVTSIEGLLGAPAELTFPEGSIGAKSQTAYLFEATGLYSTNLLRTLLEQGIRVQVAQRPFTAAERKWDCGTAIVEVADQPLDSERLYALLCEAAQVNGIEVLAADDTFNPDTCKAAEARLPKVAVLVGQGMTDTAAGELWMLLERHYGMAPTRLPIASLKKASLADYQVIIAAHNTQVPDEKGLDSLRKWVKKGGTLITTQGSYQLANRARLTRIKAAHGTTSAKLAGVILATTIDPTSPLGYGYRTTELPMMKQTKTIYKTPRSKQTLVPMCYTAEPRLSGYLTAEQNEQLASTPAAVVTKCDQGCVIHLADNPTFRSYWFGATKLLMNAIYFGHLY